MLNSRKISIPLILLLLPFWSACDADRETSDPTFRQKIEEQRVQAFVNAARQGHAGKIQLFLETDLGENQNVLTPGCHWRNFSASPLPWITGTQRR